MSTFILVHGAWHGAWSWAEVIRELEARGHVGVASELPCDEPEAGWEDYAKAVLDNAAEYRGDLVVVGHSLGGGVIPLVAAQLPATRMVFVCSLPPEPQRALNDVAGEEPNLTDARASSFREELDEKGRYVWRDFETARYAMYEDCPIAEARRAFELLRPQSVKPFSEIWPLAQWPDLPTTFVTCAQDRMGSPSCLARVARRRFGVEAVQLDGGHSPMLSRPKELVRALLSG
jgi:pimeloyl-ACP methyl ester carboxylesterase